MNEMTPAEARSALDAVEQGRLRVVEQIAVPAWYWWSVALGWVALGVISDLGHPWVTVAATLVFGAVHSWVAPRVIDGRHGSGQLSVRADVVGRHLAVVVLGGLVALVVVTVAAALALDADGARHPATIASLFVAVIALLGGPLLTGRVRRAAADRVLAASS